MSHIHPINSLLEASSNNTDMLYRGMKNYFLYFEDNGKQGFYKVLIERLFPNEKIYIDTNSNGKSDLIKRYFENEEKYKNTNNKKFIFILDKDFDDKRYFLSCKNLLGKTFEEIKNHINFLIFTHYSIENYFLKDEATITEACFIAYGIAEKSITDVFQKTKELFVKISKIIYIQNVIDLEKNNGVDRFIDYSTICLKNDEIKKVEKEYEENFNKRKKTIFCKKKCNKDFSYSEVKNIILTLFDNQKDIIGKEFIMTILKVLKIKYKKKQVNKDLFFRSLLMLSIKNEVLDELKQELSIIFNQK